jgi:hypothetical protein
MSVEIMKNHWRDYRVSIKNDSRITILRRGIPSLWRHKKRAFSRFTKFTFYFRKDTTDFGNKFISILRKFRTSNELPLNHIDLIPYKLP